MKREAAGRGPNNLSAGSDPHPIRLVADAAREERLGGIRAWREETDTGNAIALCLSAGQYQRDLARAYEEGLSTGWLRGITLGVVTCVIAAGTWIACWWITYGGVK